jgi:hypothetical protein
LDSTFGEKAKITAGKSGQFDVETKKPGGFVGRILDKLRN